MFFFSFFLFTTVLNCHTFYPFKKKDRQGGKKHLPICQAAEEANSVGQMNQVTSWEEQKTKQQLKYQNKGHREQLQKDNVGFALMKQLHDNNLFYITWFSLQSLTERGVSYKVFLIHSTEALSSTVQLWNLLRIAFLFGLSLLPCLMLPLSYTRRD